MSFLIGIDPGTSGAVAIMGKEGWRIADCPKQRAERGFVSDIQGMAELLRPAANCGSRCVIEQVHSRPGEGVSSAFKFGQNYGAWLGVLHALNIDVYPVSPMKWKRAMELLGTNKEASRAKALKLAPHLEDWLQRKKDHGRAEAVLLVHFAIAIPH